MSTEAFVLFSIACIDPPKKIGIRFSIFVLSDCNCFWLANVVYMLFQAILEEKIDEPAVDGNCSFNYWNNHKPGVVKNMPVFNNEVDCIS